jgi:hypothetical protein
MLCPVRRPVTALDCVLLKDRTKQEINSIIRNKQEIIMSIVYFLFHTIYNTNKYQ